MNNQIINQRSNERMMVEMVIWKGTRRVRFLPAIKNNACARLVCKTLFSNQGENNSSLTLT